MNVSVIVCTRNRADCLPGLFNSLERLIVPEGFRWEVVIVDNASTDGTREICSPFVKKNPKRFVYVHEPRKGKSIALNTGVNAAKGEILVFTDDDCIADEHWLTATAREFAADPDVGVVGGRVELYDQRDKPFTIITRREQIELRGVFSKSSPEGPLLFNSVVFGCNMAVKRDVFRRVGNYDVSLGPGTATKSIEDIEFVYRAFRNGFKVIYCPTVLVYHNHGRRTDEAVNALQFDYVRGRGAFYAKHIFGDYQVFQCAFWDVYRVAKRICTGKSVRWSVQYLHALAGGVLARMFGRRAR